MCTDVGVLLCVGVIMAEKLQKVNAEYRKVNTSL